MIRARALDPRFSTILAAAKGAGWIACALARDEAEMVALASGFTFAEALREIGRVPSRPEMSSFVVMPEEAPEVSTARPRFVGLPVDVADAIAHALKADPSRSDRAIARLCRCSPTTVGRARAAAGLPPSPKVHAGNLTSKRV